MWAPWDKPGIEHLHLSSRRGAVADGLIIGIGEGKLFRVSYLVRCDASWRIRRVRVRMLASDRRSIGLRSDGDGRWLDDRGEPVPELEGCTDVDLSATPFTNTLPIRRLGLRPGHSAELLVAYVDVPSLRVRADRQRYTCLDLTSDRAVYRYEGLSSGFAAELTVDVDGLVVDYPPLFRRVWLAATVSGE